MALQLANLDQPTRRYMLDELDRDLSEGRLYLSPRLTSDGHQVWPALVREAIRGGSDSSLAARLRSEELMNATEERRAPKGGITVARVPENAPDTLAEGEFNRFYVRGLCRRAIDAGVTELEIYRAKEVVRPRPESEVKIGGRVDPQQLLQDLRTSQGVEPALGLPPGPNSGLSVRLP